MSEPVEPKGYTPKEIFQQIKSENQWEVDLDLDPKDLPWIYIGNIIQRTLSRMIGQGPLGPVTVKCTKEGNLAVVSRGGAFDDYERLEWPFAAANEEHEFQFAQQVERIDIFTYDGKADYQLTRDLVKPYGDKIELFTDSFYSLDFYIKRVKVTCKSFAPKESGTNTTATDNKLIDNLATFQAKNVGVGDVVSHIDENRYATVTAIDSETELVPSENIFPASEGTGKSYTIEGTRVKLMGWFRAEG
ncbi:hypothetical protein ES703_43970 [subsurface metagenome]